MASMRACTTSSSRARFRRRSWHKPAKSSMVHMKRVRMMQAERARPASFSPFSYVRSLPAQFHSALSKLAQSFLLGCQFGALLLDHFRFGFGDERCVRQLALDAGDFLPRLGDLFVESLQFLAEIKQTGQGQVDFDGTGQQAHGL